MLGDSLSCWQADGVKWECKRRLDALANAPCDRGRLGLLKAEGWR